MAIYMLYKGQSQGTVQGSVTSKGYENQIEVLSLQFGMGHPTGANSAITTGKQVARPLVLTKRTDKSSPLILSSCDTNENLTTVVMTYVYEGASKAVATTTLTNAMVQDFNHTAAEDGSGHETITFSYQKCEFTWSDGGITHEWDMTK